MYKSEITKIVQRQIDGRSQKKSRCRVMKMMIIIRMIKMMRMIRIERMIKRMRMMMMMKIMRMMKKIRWKVRKRSLFSAG